MAVPERVKNQMKKNGLSGVNKPKRTPNHPKKSHVVMASENGKYRLIRFGEQGASVAGKPKKGEPEAMKKKRKRFKSRFGIGKKKLSKLGALYWSNREKW